MKKKLAFCLLMMFSLCRIWSFGKKDSVKQGASEKTENNVFSGQNDYPDYPDYFNNVLNSSLEDIYLKSYLKGVQEFSKKSQTDDVLNFGREKFIKDNPNPENYSESDKAIKKIYELEKNYEKIWKDTKVEAENFCAAVRTDSFEKTAEYSDSLSASFAELKKIEDETAEQGKIIQRQFQKLLAEDKTYEKSWLSYSSKFVLGTGKTQGTGLVSAMKIASKSLLDTMKSSIEAKALSKAKIIESGLTEKEILKRQADGNLPPREKYLNAAKDLQNLCFALDVYSAIDKNSGITTEGKRRKHEENLKKSSELLFLIGEKTNKIFTLADSINDLQKEATLIASDTGDALSMIREENDTITLNLAIFSRNFSAKADEAESLEKEKWLKNADDLTDDVCQWKDEVEIFKNACQLMKNYSSKRTEELLVKASERLMNAGEEMYEKNTANYEETKKLAPYLLEENSERTDLKQYPRKFLEQTGEIRNRIAADITSLEKAATSLNEAGTKFKSNIQVMQKRLKEPQDKLKALDKKCKNDSEIILTQQLEAKTAINEVTLYYERALSAFNSENYTGTQNFLNKAVKTYDSILFDLRKDSDIQGETYTNLTKLKQELVEKQRPLLIKRLRELKIKIKNYYYAGDFEEANACIIQTDQVREEWAIFMDSQMNRDDELERLRTLVNTALSIKNGRVLNPEDPLYPEMSQILSISYQYYSEGSKKLKGKESKEGKKLLKKAKDKLNELKVVYPRNKEASLLSMRIDKILDIKSFNSMFKERISQLKKVKYSSRDALAVASYGDLQDLYEMDSSYPGLGDFIYNVEIDLGLREKPVDNSAKEAAEAIAQEALAQLDNAGRDSLILEGIKAKAREALNLDENNGTALAVLDEIALRTGAQAAVVLSAEDEAKYQQTVSYLQNGNIIAANANLQQLLQKSENARSAKILKLKNRIEGMLK